MSIKISDLEFINILECLKADQLLLREIRNKENIRNNMINNHIISEQEHSCWLDNLKTLNNYKGFIIYLNKYLAGYVYINEVDYNKNEASWGIYIDASNFLGLGIVSEFKFLDWFFLEFNFQNVACKVFDFNGSTLRLHKKFGFEEIDNKKSNIKRNEKLHHLIHLEISKEKWIIMRDLIKKEFNLI